MSDFSALSTSEIVAKYNEATGESVKRFATRAIGEKRLAEALAKTAGPDLSDENVNGETVAGPDLSDATTSDIETVEAAKVAGDGVEAVSAETAISAPSSAVEGSEATSAQVDSDPAVSEAGASVETSTSVEPVSEPTVKKSVASRERGINLDPKEKVYAARFGSKQALLIDLLSRKNGATLRELSEALASAGGKAWTPESVKTGLRWDVNSVKGYGIATEFTGSVELLKEEGRTAEAEALAADPSIGPIAVYVLVYPEGVSKPLPHVKSKSLLAAEEKAKAPKAAKTGA